MNIKPDHGEKTERGVRIARFQTGFTLIELVVVIAILAVVAALVTVKTGAMGRHAADTAAKALLVTVRDAFCGAASSPGLLADMKYVPGFQETELRIGHLLSTNSWPAGSSLEAYDPDRRRGWRGPYVRCASGVRIFDSDRTGMFPGKNDRSLEDGPTFEARGFYPNSIDYGTTNDYAIADPWGNPIVLQIPSSGFDYARVLSAGPNGEIDTDADIPMPTKVERDDDLLLFLSRADEI